MRRQRELAKARKTVPSRAPPTIDLTATERSFLESCSRELPKLPGNQLAYPVPEPRFSDISSIQPGDATYVVSTKTPHKISRSVACSTPLRYNRAVMEVPPSAMKSVPEEEPVSEAGLHPATAMVLTCDEDYFMSRDERTERQFDAMSVWCNMILRSQYDDEEFDIGATKKEANKVLQDLLVKSKAQMSSSVTVDKPFKYSDFLKRQKRDNTRERAMRLFNSTNVPERIRDSVNCRLFSVRAGCNVYSDLSLQMTLLRLFLSFHPAWLHLGLETVFHTSIDVNENEKFIHVISRFIIQRVFADPKILRNQNYAYGNHNAINPSPMSSEDPLERSKGHKNWSVSNCSTTDKTPNGVAIWWLGTTKTASAVNRISSRIMAMRKDTEGYWKLISLYASQAGCPVFEKDGLYLSLYEAI
ncbi:unnamed protein product [Haemonchus placei]|uniref:Uncharacterized protein n=1 Tax=Haemonchus placei TaxID=6290 RepID=A0A158QLH8_HAEPC|nr:unnamed protein product [Haemonchus placei]